MKYNFSLDGIWQLSYYDATKMQYESETEMRRAHLPTIAAEVPGNVELDLSRAGILPKDLFRGMATVTSEQIEPYDFWYTKTFDAPSYAAGETVWLCFDAVDCVADYYVNGVLAYTSKNAFIPQEFEITEYLCKGENRISVHLHSSLLAILNQDMDEYRTVCWTTLPEATTLRKPAHSFGWDIFPRAISAGLWRSVRMEVRDAYQLLQVGYKTQSLSDLQFYFSFTAPTAEVLAEDFCVTVRGICSDSTFFGEWHATKRTFGILNVHVNQPKLWWPYGYGEANVYDTVITLSSRGKVLAEHTMNVGIRELTLDRTDSLHCENPRFRFLVNGTEVMCRGSNWVPLDAYHSRDKSRYPKALELATEIGCNILRVWGGGVYEADQFYDYCDRHGILIWQDFMMGCKVYPQDEMSMQAYTKEFTTVIKLLRHHPCIALWAGDNEIDTMFATIGQKPSFNLITHELLPQLVRLHDYQRPYLPSSPYVTDEMVTPYRRGKSILPEDHLWGARDYFKADFYRNSEACFVSETGYHGCPSTESVAKIVDEEFVFPIHNAQWTLHSSDQRGSDHRVRLMEDQIRQLFAFTPDNLTDFSLASQISQAEAMKYFIERIRIRRPKTGGIIWWNLLDGWPQMSDAVVDYFFEKKLAFSYIKRAQAPFTMMIGELADWHYPLYAANDTLQTYKGCYRVTDLSNGAILTQGNFTVEPNRTKQITRFRMLYSEKTMLLIRFETENGIGFNHYLAGYPAFDFQTYCHWMQTMQSEIGE